MRRNAKVFHPLSSADKKLIEAATDVLRKNYRPELHTVGAAVLCGSGRIYSGINVEACGYGPCAEPVAIGTAFSNGERDIKAIVAVCRSRAGYCVLPPCGNCRQLIVDYAPDAWVILNHNGKPSKARARDLLPESYHHIEKAHRGKPKRGR